MSEPKDTLRGDAPSWSPERHGRVREGVMRALDRAPRRPARSPARLPWLVAAAILVLASAALGAARLGWIALAPATSVSAPVAPSAPPGEGRRARVYAQPGARFAALDGDPAGEVVRVWGGAATIEIAPGDTEARALSGDAEIAARDASFDVVVEDDRLRSLRVIAGQVVLRREGQPPRTLAAGERWAAPEAPSPTASPTASAEAVPAASASAAPAASARASASTARPKENADERAFNEAWSALERGDYGAAQKSLARVSSGSPLAEDAEYWRAVALARAGDEAGARAALTRFLAAHPSSARKAEAEGLLAKLSAKGRP